MIKMIVCDLDGTLLHADFTYTKRTMDSIKKAIYQGIQFLPASGRTFQDIASIFHKEGILCGAICVNGAQACDEQGKVLYTNEMDTSTCKDILDVLKQHTLHAQIFTDKGFYAYENATQVAFNMQKVISRNMKKDITIEKAMVIQTQELAKHTILKLETMSIDDAILTQCKNQLQKIAHIEVTSSVHGNLEITHMHSTKGNMLEKILSDYHIEKDEVLIFGDSDNDKSMFTRFPNTVAVANAKNSILQIARCICDRCEEDGVAKYIEEYLCK